MANDGIKLIGQRTAAFEDLLFRQHRRVNCISAVAFITAFATCGISLCCLRAIPCDSPPEVENCGAPLAGLRDHEYEACNSQIESLNVQICLLKLQVEKHILTATAALLEEARYIKKAIDTLLGMGFSATHENSSCFYGAKVEAKNPTLTKRLQQHQRIIEGDITQLQALYEQEKSTSLTHAPVRTAVAGRFGITTSPSATTTSSEGAHGTGAGASTSISPRV